MEIIQVPQQRNDEECGNFVLYFINLFMESAPPNFSMEGYPYFVSFPSNHMFLFYDMLNSCYIFSVTFCFNCRWRKVGLPLKGWIASARNYIPQQSDVRNFNGGRKESL